MLKNMLKRNKWHLLASSAIILLPIAFGLAVWERLPAQMPVHWGVNGEVDGYASRGVAVLLLPLLLLAVQWLCVIASAFDRRSAEQSPKVQRMVLWIVPVLSLVISAIVYATAFQMPLSVNMVVPLLFGVGFIVIGNLLPKCRQSRTMGIKVKWTLEDEENWNATHRFGGRLWVIGGIAILPAAFLPENASLCVLLPVTLVLALAPAIYSYIYYRKHK